MFPLKNLARKGLISISDREIDTNTVVSEASISSLKQSD